MERNTDRKFGGCLLVYRIRWLHGRPDVCGQSEQMGHCMATAVRFMVKLPRKARSTTYREIEMELTIDEVQAKKLLKEIMIELVRERQDLFFELIVEAMEEIGLANAIREGRQDEFVTEEEIKAILEG